jgi:branched-chain amino acid transport system substrate-binding protein
LSDVYATAYGSIFGDDERPAVSDFLKAYEARFHSQPATSHFMTGYATIQVLAAGIERAKSVKGADVAKAIDSAGSIQTLLGEVKFTSKHHLETTRPEAIIEWQDGKPRMAGLYSAEGKATPK